MILEDRRSFDAFVENYFSTIFSRWKNSEQLGVDNCYVYFLVIFLFYKTILKHQEVLHRQKLMQDTSSSSQNITFEILFFLINKLY